MALGRDMTLAHVTLLRSIDRSPPAERLALIFKSEFNLPARCAVHRVHPARCSSNSRSRARSEGEARARTHARPTGPGRTRWRVRFRVSLLPPPTLAMSLGTMRRCFMSQFHPNSHCHCTIRKNQSKERRTVIDPRTILQCIKYFGPMMFVLRYGATRLKALGLKGQGRGFLYRCWPFAEHRRSSEDPLILPLLIGN